MDRCVCARSTRTRPWRRCGGGRVSPCRPVRCRSRRRRRRRRAPRSRSSIRSAASPASSCTLTGDPNDPAASRTTATSAEGARRRIAMGAVTTLRQAVASIPDGALLTFGGFQLNRAPMALVFELIRQRRRDLRVVSPPNPLALDLLAAAGAIAEAEFGFLGFQFDDGFVVAPTVKRAIEAGTLRFRERDVYEIVQALR